MSMTLVSSFLLPRRIIVPRVAFDQRTLEPFAHTNHEEDQMTID